MFTVNISAQTTCDELQDFDEKTVQSKQL